MENESTEVKSYKLSFNGNGSTFFGIVVVNWLLSVITLSIYYPWAKAKQLKYMYSSTTLNDDSFAFNGTGKEMFKGYIKTLVIFGLLFAIFGVFTYYEMPTLGILVLYFGLFTIMPIAIHGSYRYRMSRSTWRGIRFGYRGDRTELMLNFFKWIFFTIISLGIYGSWMEMNLRSYLIGNIRMGDVEFRYKGKGLDYFLLGLKGFLLTLITLGIYSFWFYKSLFEYYVNNISAYKDGKEITFKSKATASDMFNLLFVNYIILIFTLGLGYAWVVTRTMNLVFSRIQLEGDIDLDSIQQTEADYTDATGEDMSDFLNIDFIM
ncbi:MAG: DUF898 family protein [Paludibacter sp.]|nr:DUF898 family protein [Paludibacter sp.]